MAPERTLIRSEAYYAKSAIELRVDAGRAHPPEERAVVLTAGGQWLRRAGAVHRHRRAPTGAARRRAAGVFYLRTLADAARIRAAARPGAGR